MVSMLELKCKECMQLTVHLQLKLRIITILLSYYTAYESINTVERVHVCHRECMH
jgi:hypothetical protein